MALEQIRIEGGVKLKGKVGISGSKNSALPLMTAALLADGPVCIRNVPKLTDIETMMSVLEHMGAKCSRNGTSISIDGAALNNNVAPYDMVRKMRASIYVMGPLLARCGECRVSLPGGCAIGPRPVDLHLYGFEQIGADVTLEHGDINATSRLMKGGEFHLAGPHGSSVGATINVMMAATAAQGRTIIHSAAQEPQVIDVAQFINAMGGNVLGYGTDTISIEGGLPLKACDVMVNPDPIEAGTFLVAGAITDGDVTIENCRSDHLSATLGKFIEIGYDLEIKQNSIRISRSGKLRPVSIVTAPYPGFPTDMQAQFTALLTTIAGRSTVTEKIYVDRFIHVAELMRMGADIELKRGSITIRGVDHLSGAPIMASDLRASAALVLAGLKAKGTTTVSRVYHIDRGYERIDEKLKSLGARIQRLDEQGNPIAD